MDDSDSLSAAMYTCRNIWCHTCSQSQRGLSSLYCKSNLLLLWSKEQEIMSLMLTEVFHTLNCHSVVK